MRSSHALALVLAITGLGTACGADGNGPSNTPPAAAFTPSCALLVCGFADRSSDADGQVTAYTWDFGDGTAAATSKDAQHTYAAANTYIVSLTVTDNDGATNRATQSVQVSTQHNAPPTASFTSSCTDLACSFTDLSTDADGTVVSFHWGFGDGADTTTRNPTHAYASAGTYVVELTVTDDGGVTNSVSQSVQVSTANAPPTANFTSSCTDLACSFTDRSTDGDGTVVGFHWDFGDGAVAATQNSTHAYASAGTYVVELTVTDNSGATGNFSQQVTVTQSGAPTANFAGSCVVTGSYGLARLVWFDCTFTDQSTAAAGATVTAWAWDFGDGRTSTEQNPPVVHYQQVLVRTRPVSVTVRLTVTDNNGLTNGVTKRILVTPRPTP